MSERQSIGRESAIRLFESKWWEGKSPREICMVQLFTEELCMPFGDFHEAVEKSLGRSVWTHEFGVNYDGILREFLGEQRSPTLREIFEMIPEDKRIVVVLPSRATEPTGEA